MQIVTDRGADLAPSQMEGLNIHFAPLRVTLDGVTYASGVDLQSDRFYEMLSETESFPITSQPSAGDFAELYRRLAQTDPEILSIHISSGLSGTLNSAHAGALMVPEAHVTFFDSKTLSAPLGWHVQAAARAVRSGWSLERILPVLESIRAQTEGMFTLSTLKYLIHGGRISHLKGLLASLLNIKPVIGVEKEHGTYQTYGQEVTLKRAIGKMADVVAGIYSQAGHLRVQLLHGNNPEGVEILREKMISMFDCVFEPVTSIAPVLGAHTGPGMVGLSVGPLALFQDLP
jgi:DegV family protein with EDD domain